MEGHDQSLFIVASSYALPSFKNQFLSFSVFGLSIVGGVDCDVTKYSVLCSSIRDPRNGGDIDPTVINLHPAPFLKISNIPNCLIDRDRTHS